MRVLMVVVCECCRVREQIIGMIVFLIFEPLRIFKGRRRVNDKAIDEAVFFIHL